MLKFFFIWDQITHSFPNNPTPRRPSSGAKGAVTRYRPHAVHRLRHRASGRLYATFPTLPPVGWGFCAGLFLFTRRYWGNPGSLTVKESSITRFSTVATAFLTNKSCNFNMQEQIIATLMGFVINQTACKSVKNSASYEYFCFCRSLTFHPLP